TEAKKWQRREARVASTWQAVAGSPLNDQFLEWPPDLFAVTNVLLERSEAYRFALSPSSGLEWPPARFPNWSEAVEEVGRQWSLWVEDRQGPLPRLLAGGWSGLRGQNEMPLGHLAQGHQYALFEGVSAPHTIGAE